MATYLLETDSVLLRYHNRNILSDVYLACSTGSVVGLLGRNGSGKSSLLNIIFGRLRPENKSVRLNCKYVEALYLVKNAVCYQPQVGFLPANLTVLQAVNFFVRDFLQAQKIFEHPGLNLRPKELVGNLSGGKRRFLETLLVLYSPAKFILMDEPFTHLAPVFIEELTTLLPEVAQQKGIILADHQYKTIIQVSTSLLLLEGGKTHTITNQDQLIYLGYLKAAF